MSSTDGPPPAPGELLDISDIREMLAVSKTRAYVISRDRNFPDPWIDHPRVRLWRRADVEAWLDRHRPGWRDEG